jgi:anaerobic glycerol-3-phosphate dehydrogenase
MQALLLRTEARSHCAVSRGDELRRQAETCRQLATSSLMERHKLVWLRLANEWLELARRADELVVSPAQDGADLFVGAG